MSTAARFFLIAVIAFLIETQSSFGHGPVPRVSEAEAAGGRLFTADAATGDVVTVDLETGETIARLRTPPFIIGFGLSADKRHLFAMRGQSTDRDWLTVIDTGFDPDSDEMRPPHVARSILGSVPTTGGLHHGRVASIGGNEAVFMEKSGELIVFESNNFSDLDAVKIRRYTLAAADHYHYVEVGRTLYVGHLRQGFVQILDLDSGAEIGRIPGCAVLHGMAEDPESGRLFFGCAAGVLVVGTRDDEANREVARIPYPEEQRIATFSKGKDRVFWGSTEGTLPFVYRLDAAREPYTLDIVPVDDSVQQNTSEDGSLVLDLSRGGVLQARDGGSGELLWSVAVTEPFAADFHEHTDKAVLPDIQTIGGFAYITLPNSRAIAEVDLATHTVTRKIEVDGEPTRFVVIESGQAD